jgi:6-phosphogluconolactonase
MQLEIVADSSALSERVATEIATCAEESVAARGRCVMALSGGTEPWRAFARLATRPLPWHAIHVLQVDERIAPAGHPDRNWTHLCASLLERVPIPPAHVHAMPVQETDADSAAERYEALLHALTQPSGCLDLVHLGLGDDGHTASLVPGDPVLAITDRDVAVTGPYQGRSRMTLTLPAIARSRRIVWLVAGAGKAPALAALIAADPAIPASHVPRERAWLFTDRATYEPKTMPPATEEKG